MHLISLHNHLGIDPERLGSEEFEPAVSKNARYLARRARQKGLDFVAVSEWVGGRYDAFFFEAVHRNPELMGEGYEAIGNPKQYLAIFRHDIFQFYLLRFIEGRAKEGDIIFLAPEEDIKLKRDESGNPTNKQYHFDNWGGIIPNERRGLLEIIEDYRDSCAYAYLSHPTSKIAGGALRNLNRDNIHDTKSLEYHLLKMIREKRLGYEAYNATALRFGFLDYLAGFGEAERLFKEFLSGLHRGSEGHPKGVTGDDGNFGLIGNNMMGLQIDVPVLDNERPSLRDDALENVKLVGDALQQGRFSYESQNHVPYYYLIDKLVNSMRQRYLYPWLNSIHRFAKIKPKTTPLRSKGVVFGRFTLHKKRIYNREYSK